MSEDRKGHMKVTVDIEINEALMDTFKEMASKMPAMMSEAMKKSD